MYRANEDCWLVLSPTTGDSAIDIGDDCEIYSNLFGTFGRIYNPVIREVHDEPIFDCNVYPIQKGYYISITGGRTPYFYKTK